MQTAVLISFDVSRNCRYGVTRVRHAQPSCLLNLKVKTAVGSDRMYGAHTFHFALYQCTNFSTTLPKTVLSVSLSLSVDIAGVTADQTLSFEQHDVSMCRVVYTGPLRRNSIIRHLCTRTAKAPIPALLPSNVDYNCLSCQCWNPKLGETKGWVD